MPPSPAPLPPQYSSTSGETGHKVWDVWPFIRESKIVLALALACMAINAAATGAYAFLIGPLVRYVFVGELEQGSSLAGTLESLGLTPESLAAHGALPVIALLLLAAAVKAASQAGRFHFSGVIGEQAGRRLRSEMMQALHGAMPHALQGFSTGDIAARFTNDAQRFAEAVGVVLSGAVTDSLKILFLFGVALWLDWRMTLFGFVLLPLAVLPIAKVARRLRSTSTACQEETATLGSHVIEDTRTASVIRRFFAQALRRERFEQHNRALFQAGLRSFAVRAVSSPLMELVGALALGSVLLFAAWQKSLGLFVPEHFVSVFAAMLLLYEPMKNLGRLQTFYHGGLAGFARAQALLHLPRSISNGERWQPSEAPSLHWENVSLVLNERPILHGVTLHVAAGRSLALVGPSGAGKTSLASLLLGEMPLAAGRVRLDEHEVSTLHPESLSRLVAVVEQRPMLFDDTLEGNIRIGDPDASPEALVEALRLSGLDDLLLRLPDGLGTRLMEEGLRLSEGERQRIALARALLRRPKVLILDEATSAQDARSEQWIRDVVQRLDGKVTRLVIAHRLSTLAGTNRVAVLKDGHLVEQGTQDELLRTDSLFREFHRCQRLPGETDTET